MDTGTAQPASRTARWANKLAVESEPGLTNTQLMLTNHDLKPVEAARRQWGPWNFVGFWIADSFNINTWMISSSMIVGGLSWWQAWLCVWIGYAIAGCFIVLTGRIGAVYHIGFPVVGRSSFGIWGSLWPVFNRSAMGKSLSRKKRNNILRTVLTQGCSVYLVRCPGLHRRSLRVHHDPFHLEVLEPRSNRLQRFRRS